MALPQSTLDLKRRSSGAESLPEVMTLTISTSLAAMHAGLVINYSCGKASLIITSKTCFNLPTKKSDHRKAQSNQVCLFYSRQRKIEHCNTPHFDANLNITTDGLGGSSAIGPQE